MWDQRSLFQNVVMCCSNNAAMGISCLRVVFVTVIFTFMLDLTIHCLYALFEIQIIGTVL